MATLMTRKFFSFATHYYDFAVRLHRLGCSTSGPVSSGMGDRLWAGKSRQVSQKKTQT